MYHEDGTVCSLADQNEKDILELEKIIESQKKIIEELKRSNEFYANPESWMIKDKNSWRKSSPKSHGDDEIILKYHHPLRDWVGTITVGGKLAREVKQNVEKMEKEL